jgi:1,2-diacylglycerol 3-alpha-glucosyltransferase
MKIVHCCLAAFYIDNYSYQENILPKMHKQLGHDVSIIASTETYINNKLGYLKPGEYENEHGINVKRISYTKWLPDFFKKKLRLYSGLFQSINKIRPDIIFLHDCQFLGIFEIIKYAKKNQVKIIIDSHTDNINSANSIISFYILHKIIYKFCAKSIEKYTSIFWGTLPSRELFLINTYGINVDKVKFLPFGHDDTLFKFSDSENIKKTFRHKNNFNKNDFLIVTGGKIDKRKNILLLIKAFKNFINTNNIENVKLLIFGKPSDNLAIEFYELVKDKNIRYLNWVPANEIHKVFISSDLAFFPGTHSIHWEEAAGIGIPCIYKKWDGMSHLDLGGNCIFLDKINNESLVSILEKIIFNDIFYNKLLVSSRKLGPNYFSYSTIASKSINV